MKDKINFFEEKELGNTKATITQNQEGGFYTVHIKDGEENILLKQYKTLLGARKCVNNYITTPSAKKESDVIFKPIGQQIRELRLERGWSQAKLATESGLKEPVSIYHYERGTYKPSPETAVRIARALGCVYYELLHPTEDFYKAKEEEQEG